MTKVRGLFGIALAVVILASLPATYFSQNPPSQNPPANDRAVADKTWNGQLVKVDMQTKLITVKGPDQKDMSFAFNDATQIVSPDKTIQGLTGKTGAELKITYHEERGSNLATKIELLEKQQ